MVIHSLIEACCVSLDWHWVVADSNDQLVFVERKQMQGMAAAAAPGRVLQDVTASGSITICCSAAAACMYIFKRIPPIVPSLSYYSYILMSVCGNKEPLLVRNTGRFICPWFCTAQKMGSRDGRAAIQLGEELNMFPIHSSWVLNLGPAVGSQVCYQPTTWLRSSPSLLVVEPMTSDWDNHLMTATVQLQTMKAKTLLFHETYIAIVTDTNDWYLWAREWDTELPDNTANIRRHQSPQYIPTVVVALVPVFIVLLTNIAC